MQRGAGVVLLVLALGLAGTGCGGDAGQAGPTASACAGVTCSGHGVCGVTLAGAAVCACGAGYHAESLTCVLDGAGACQKRWQMTTTLSGGQTLQFGGTGLVLGDSAISSTLALGLSQYGRVSGPIHVEVDVRDYDLTGDAELRISLHALASGVIAGSNMMFFDGSLRSNSWLVSPRGSIGGFDEAPTYGVLQPHAYTFQWDGATLSSTGLGGQASGSSAVSIAGPVVLSIELLSRDPRGVAGTVGGPGTASVRIPSVTVSGDTTLQSDGFACDSVDR